KQALKNNVWIPDVDNSNHFLYDERISAAYLFYQSKSAKSWDADLGLRVENTQMDGRSVATGQRNRRSFFDLFPSLSITQAVSENYTLSYNVNFHFFGLLFYISSFVTTEDKTISLLF